MIDTSTWKEFCVGELFSCETTLGIPSKNDLEDGNINYITRSALDNGFSGTCGNEDHLNKGNCITIGAEGFVAFWQTDDFVAGNKVYALRHSKLNEINGLFVCTALNALSSRYSFADARVLDKIKVEVIKLPATPDGQPDWDYMESYMKAIMGGQNRQLNSLAALSDSPHLIDVSGWGKFRVGDLFDVVKGTRLTKADMKDGTIKFVGSSAMNNGETHRIANNEKLHPANTITVCYNGSVGETFYQDESFWASDDVNVLYPKFDMTKLIAMFICPIIKSVGKKYAFIDKWKQENMKNEIIRLPITSTGEPYWQYMEDYMRSIMSKSEKTIDNLSKAAS